MKSIQNRVTAFIMAVLIAVFSMMPAEALMVALEAQMMERLDDYKTAV